MGVSVQTATGFGSMLVCITLGAWLLPVQELTALLVPVMLLQTVYIALRHYNGVMWRLLLLRILPLMTVGVAVGMSLTSLSTRGLRPMLGLLIAVLALRELVRKKPARPISAWMGAIVTLTAGVVHGIFVTGGPLLVWVVGRGDVDKDRLRTTLSVVWLCLHIVLLTGFVAQGQVTGATLSRSAMLLPALVVGVAAGEWLYSRVDEVRFKRALWLGLLAASVPLILK